MEYEALFIEPEEEKEEAELELEEIQEAVRKLPKDLQARYKFLLK